MESFERINFFGEDAEDVLSAGRPHTPVGGGTLSTHVPSVAASGVYTTLKYILSSLTQEIQLSLISTQLLFVL